MLCGVMVLQVMRGEGCGGGGVVIVPLTLFDKKKINVTKIMHFVLIYLIGIYFLLYGYLVPCPSPLL